MSQAQLYSTIFLYLTIVLTLIYALQLSNQSYSRIKKGSNNSVFALVLCLCLAYWIGIRTPSYEFADTGNYAHMFHLYKAHIPVDEAVDSEWVWNHFTYYCSQTMSESMYFILIAMGYFGFTLWACRILTPNNTMVTLLFVMGAFSFYSYATNGIRNGLACSIALAVIAMIAKSRKNLIPALILAFMASNIHKTTLLPLACLFLSVYLIKSFKWAYTFWILSILISLVAGNAINVFFASLGFDDRLSYLTVQTAEKFSHTGFRWDFLLYSMMPIVLGYYVVISRGIQDKVYMILLNTYTISNAFWVMVIRANYSNRFAYLSWFMYALVLAYPLLRINIWGKRQGLYTAMIMLAHVVLTWVL